MKQTQSEKGRVIITRTGEFTNIITNIMFKTTNFRDSQGWKNLATQLRHSEPMSACESPSDHIELQRARKSQSEPE